MHIKIASILVVLASITGLVTVGLFVQHDANISAQNETATQLPVIPEEEPPTATQLPVFPEAEEGNETTAEEQPPVEETPAVGFLPTDVFQDDTHIVFTVTKDAAQGPPEGPIIIIPPPAGEEGNGTIITPGENVSAENPGNITIIEPDGNVTQIEDGNMTQIDNDTVVIVPDDEVVTETPGNVTVIDPEVPEPCGCPPAGTGNETQGEIPPVTVIPAPGQNITQEVPAPAPEPAPEPEPPVATQLPVFPEEGNQTTGNETTAEEEQPPQATQLPASTTVYPWWNNLVTS